MQHIDIKIKSVLFINYTCTFAFGICPDIVDIFTH